MEAIIRLMEASWVVLSHRSEGIVFSATELGQSVSSSEELPINSRRIARWRNFITDKVTGTVYRSRELPVFEKHVLEKRAEQERFVYIAPRDVAAEDHVRSVVATLFDDDERFVAMEPSGDRLVDRFAVVTYRNGKIEGLPTRAPRELDEIISAAAKSAGTSASGTVTYKPAPAPVEVEPSTLVPRSVVFSSDDLILGSDQHRELFDAILKNCRHELIIHSTFISDERFETLLPEIVKAIQRGVKVDILWGQDNEKTQVSTSKTTVGRLRQKISSLALDDVLHVHPFSTRSHAKLIVADSGKPDRHLAVVGSCNWLSSNIQSFEGSVRVRDPSLVADIVDQIAELSLGDDGHWTELTNYLACLGSDIRREPSPAGARANAHLVLGPEHGALVRRARDSAKQRLFVTSHRLSAVARPAVILPAMAAAGGNSELEARLYFGIPSGEGAGVKAADVTLEASFAGVRVRPVREPRIHAKLLAWDDDYLVVTSQNWLSADPGEGNRRKEIGLFLHAAGVARRTIEFFEAMRKS
jgi:phosphatidylserine/phosphatidylglycerophosphate/cardiolipin synthase-like enzyme